jgi:nucleotide-binding universal stress UspA family protein
MGNTVLVAIDFSEFSLKVLESGIKLAKGLKGKVDLIHVEEDIYRIKRSHETTPMDEEFFPVIERFHEARLSQCQKELDKLHKKIPSALRGKKIIVEGHPTEEIARYIDSNKVAVLVIGSHGSSNLSMSRLGSTTEKLARKALCSVLIIK